MKLNPTAKEYKPTWEPARTYNSTPASAASFHPNQSQSATYHPPYSHTYYYSSHQQQQQQPLQRVYTDPHATWRSEPRQSQPFEPYVNNNKTKVSEKPRVDAPEYIPLLARGSASASQRPVLTNREGPTEISPTNPIVVLFIGCRGAGKTTQAISLAKEHNLLHISSGDICKEGKEPFTELKAIVKKEFSNFCSRRYSGLALDRFIVRSEIDAYYLQDALSEGRLPVPLVVWLQVDSSVGMDRAASRGDNKEASLFWRLEEQRILPVVAETIFKPIKSLLIVDCNTKTAEETFNTILEHIRTTNSGRSKGVTLPAVKNSFSGALVVDFDVYKELSTEIHSAIGNSSARIDSAPLSSMAAYADRRTFTPENIRKFGLSSSFVTLKADGDRYLLVKHRVKGYYAFPFKFSHCFFVGDHLEECKLAARPSIDPQHELRNKKETNIDLILDTELCELERGYGTFFIIDFVYLLSAQGTRTRFAERYKLLQQVMEPLPPLQAGKKVPMTLKQYVSINKLAELLPSLEEAPFPIDGVVFQHGDTYVYGSDKLLFKWKPQELCTADARLADGIEIRRGVWQFHLHVGTFSDGTWREEAFPGAVAEFTEDEVTQNGLANSSIVELSLKERVSAEKSVWQFYRCRHDKTGPNKKMIVEKILEMHHLSYTELLSLVSEIPFTPLPALNFPLFSHR